MSQAGAAFGSAAAKHVTAGLSGHAFHKAVFAAALSFFGLISLFGHRY